MGQVQARETTPDDLWISQPWRRYGVSRVTWWSWRRQGHAPQPVQIGPNTQRYRLSDLLAFEARRAAR
jgi:predicted DNA-binding transcriptional regulator AlpA